MKRENCIEVKYANTLSVADLTRFFSNAGPVLKVEKEENSKYVLVVKYFLFRNSLVKKLFKKHLGLMGEFWIQNLLK